MNVRDLEKGQHPANLSILYGETVQSRTEENLYDLFCQAAETYPERYALAVEGKEYTYSELKALTEKCAAYLYEKGVRSGQKIAVTGYRNVYTMAAIYAVLKLKAVYVPIDTEYSAERICYLLNTSESEKMILTGEVSSEILEKISAIDITGAEFAEAVPSGKIQTEEISNPGVYIIYTSGTTGKPKGSLIKTDGLVNLCRWYNDTFSITEQSKVLFLYSFGFDSSVKNIFSPLMIGAEVILGPKTLYDMDSVMQIIQKYHPTHLNSVPKLIDLIIQFDKINHYKNIQTFEYLLSGGEALTANGFHALSGIHSPIIGNLYGPTECTSVNTFMKNTVSELLNAETISIGKPIYHKIICITDENGEILEKGQKGEILIAGCGVSDGYVNQMQTDKFLTSNLGTIYRTGDIGYINSDDYIEFCGRNDSQVKIDGHRIELTEIKCTAESVAGVEWFEAKIISEELVGFIRFSYTTLEQIKAKMREWLPVYMIPSFFVPVTEIPLTVNGKTDYQKLTALYYSLKNQHNSQKIIKKSHDEQTALMIRLWSEILGTDDFGIESDFFQSGGSSMKLIDLKMKIGTETGKNINIAELLDASTVSKMAALLKKEHTAPVISDNSAQERIKARLARNHKVKQRKTGEKT